MGVRLHACMHACARACQGHTARLPAPRTTVKGSQLKEEGRGGLPHAYTPVHACVLACRCAHARTHACTHTTSPPHPPPGRAQKAEEDAARVYEDFVESFQSEPRRQAVQRAQGGPNMAFVRGGMVMPGQRAEDGEMREGCTCTLLLPSTAALLHAAAAPVPHLLLFMSTSRMKV